MTFKTFKKQFTFFCIFLLVSSSYQSLDEAMITDKTYQVYTTKPTTTTPSYGNTTYNKPTTTNQYTAPVQSYVNNTYNKPAATATNNQYTAPAQSYGNNTYNRPAVTASNNQYTAPVQSYGNNTYNRPAATATNNQYTAPASTYQQPAADQQSYWDNQYITQSNDQYSNTPSYGQNLGYSSYQADGAANRNYDYKSENYQRLTRQQKLNILWQKIIQNDTPGAIPTYEEFEKIMVQDPSLTLNYDSDVMPQDRKKRIHKQGVVQQVKFIADKESPYSGLFQGGADSCIARYSLANAVDFKYIDRASASEAYNQFSPSIAIKCLVDGKASANIFGMYSFNGQSSWNWFKNNLYNHLPDPYGLTIDMIHKKFSTATPYTQILGTTTFSKYQQNGYSVQNPLIPFKIVFVPNERYQKLWSDDYNRSQDWIYQLKKIKRGETVYTVWAIDDPATGCSQKIGSIVANSYAVTSNFADEQLFFRHDAWDKDLQLQPDWEVYSASRNPDPVDYKPMGQCPIQRAQQCFSLCKASNLVCKAMCGLLIIDTTQNVQINKILATATKTTSTLIETETETKDESSSIKSETQNLIESKSINGGSMICDFACEQEQCLQDCNTQERTCQAEQKECRPQCLDNLNTCLDTCSTINESNDAKKACQINCYSLNTICQAECTIRTDICAGVCQPETYNGLALYQTQNTPCQNLCTANELQCITECAGVTGVPAAQNPTACINACRDQTRTCRNDCDTCQPNCIKEQKVCVQNCNGNSTCIKECSAVLKACQATCNFGFDCQNNCQASTSNYLAQRNYTSYSSYSNNNMNGFSSNSYTNGFSYASGYSSANTYGANSYGYSQRNYPVQQTPCQRACSSLRQVCYASCYGGAPGTVSDCIEQCNTEYIGCSQDCPQCNAFCLSEYQACYANSDEGGCADTNLSPEERACACSICQSFLTECQSYCEASVRLDCLGIPFISSPILYYINVIDIPTPSCTNCNMELNGLVQTRARANRVSQNRVINNIVSKLGGNIPSSLRTLSNKQLTRTSKQQNGIVQLTKSKNKSLRRFMNTIVANNPNQFSQNTLQVTLKAANTAKLINARSQKSSKAKGF